MLLEDLLMSAAANPMKMDEFSALARQIEAEVGRVIVGQREIVRSAIICIIAGRHALLEGVPGLGKTMLIRTLSDVLDLPFSRIQFTPDLMPADITGTDILEDTEQGGKVRRFQAGPIFASLVLADEINRATPKTQAAMLEAMQEKTVTVGGKRYELKEPFFVLATQNPLDMEGTYPLPEAQLDRFLFKVNVTFPSVGDLITILERTTGTMTTLPQKVANAEQVMAMRQLALSTPVVSHITDYVARLIVATHPESPTATPMVKQYVGVGASPRGAQALILGAKVNALLEGRFNVAYEDVEAVVLPSLRHRILLNFEGKGADIATDVVLQDLLKTVKR
jgi:MoxR-like ATPase